MEPLFSVTSCKPHKRCTASVWVLTNLTAKLERERERVGERERKRERGRERRGERERERACCTVVADPVCQSAHFK